jgi:hypothetical protein
MMQVGPLVGFQYVESTTTGPDATGPNIQAAMTAILNVARANNGRLSRPKFVRLGFHDCVGGCDGCVDLGNPDIFGLEEPIDALASVVAAHTSDGGLTRAEQNSVSVSTASAPPRFAKTARKLSNFKFPSLNASVAMNKGPDFVYSGSFTSTFLSMPFSICDSNLRS